MNGSNFPSPKYLVRSPGGNQQLAARQPLHLQPNTPYMSPRGNRLSSPRSNLRSPDFIPLGISSPVGRVRQRPSWKNPNYSNSSYTSNSTSPPSSNSSFNYSPYQRNSHRGNFNRGRRNFNNSGSSSPHISLFITKGMLENPWAELEKKLKETPGYEDCDISSDSEKSQNSPVSVASDLESENLS